MDVFRRSFTSEKKDCNCKHGAGQVWWFTSQVVGIPLLTNLSSQDEPSDGAFFRKGFHMSKERKRRGAKGMATSGRSRRGGLSSDAGRGAATARPFKQNVADPGDLQVFAYEINFGPMEIEDGVSRLTDSERDAIDGISNELRTTKASKLVSRLEEMTKRFPDVPKLWNHLAVAYESARRKSDYERIVEETHHRFPDYLFGTLNLALLRLHQGRPEEVPRILEGKFLLHDLQGGRMRYHISEVRTFLVLLARYFLAIDAIENAASHLDSLEQLDPEHPATKNVRAAMLAKLIQHRLFGSRKTSGSQMKD
jgi:hypothetical protein